MKRIFKCGGIFLFVATAGCGQPGNQSAYQQGSDRCSDQFVNDYNSIALSMKFTRTENDLDKSQNLINDFSSKYQGVVCKAGLRDGNHLDPTPTTIDVNSKVTEWKNLIASARSQNTPSIIHSNPPPPLAPNPTALPTPLPTTPAGPIVAVPDPTRDVTITSLKDGIALEVIDADSFNRFADSGHSVLIQNGKGSTVDSLDRSSDLCYLEMTKGTATFKKDDQVKFVTRVLSDKLEGIATGALLELGCIKLSSRQDWKLRDLDKVFMGLAKVISNN